MLRTKSEVTVVFPQLLGVQHQLARAPGEADRKLRRAEGAVAVIGIVSLELMLMVLR